MDMDDIKAFEHAWDSLTDEQRREVADDRTHGVSDETFQRLILRDGPPIVALVGFTQSVDGTSRYVDAGFVDYVQGRLERG